MAGRPGTASVRPNRGAFSNAWRRKRDTGGLRLVDRAAERARDHVTAADADRDDWVEYWGTRIGRMLGSCCSSG